MLTDQQLMLRKRGIGGSDVSAILGLSRYSSALHVYLSKRDELPGEEEKRNEESKLFGSLCEDVAIKIYRERTGRRVRKTKRLYRHKAYPYMCGFVDGVQYDTITNARGVAEVKWLDASQRSVWVNQGVPEGYYLQLQHYMSVLNVTWGTFVVVFGGNKFEYFDVQRDDALIARLIEVEGEFWGRVERGEPPDLTFDELGKSLLKRLYPKQEPGKEMISDDEDARAKARRLFALSATIKQREADLLGIEVWFKNRMQDAEKLLVPGVATLTWKAQSSNRFDAVRFRKDDPAVAARYTNVSESRVFRKVPIGDEEVALVEDEMITTAPQAARRITFDE